MSDGDAQEKLNILNEYQEYKPKLAYQDDGKLAAGITYTPIDGISRFVGFPGDWEGRKLTTYEGQVKTSPGTQNLDVIMNGGGLAYIEGEHIRLHIQKQGADNSVSVGSSSVGGTRASDVRVEVAKWVDGHVGIWNAENVDVLGGAKADYITISSQAKNVRIDGGEGQDTVEITSPNSAFPDQLTLRRIKAPSGGGTELRISRGETMIAEIKNVETLALKSFGHTSGQYSTIDVAKLIGAMDQLGLESAKVELDPKGELTGTLMNYSGVKTGYQR